MKFIILLLSLLLFSAPSLSVTAPVSDIKNYRVHSASFASSGLPTDDQIDTIAQAGYHHLINLLPGDYSAEELQASLLNMSYYQIEVDWHNPTIENFHSFAFIMSKIPDSENAYLHCKLNYRASSFAYLYQVIVKKESQEEAKKRLLSVWEPTQTWLNYIDTVLDYHQNLADGKTIER